MTTIGLSSSDRAANAKKPPRDDDDDDAPRPRSLLSNRPPRPFCPPQKRLLFHPPTQSVFFKGRRRLDSNPIAPNLPLLLLALFALLLLLLVDAHPLIVIDKNVFAL